MFIADSGRLRAWLESERSFPQLVANLEEVDGEVLLGCVQVFVPEQLLDDADVSGLVVSNNCEPGTQ